MTLVIDLSNNNTDVRFGELPPSITGVYLKATEGATYIDPTCAGRRKRARECGLRVGLYHFARPGGGDAKAEAKKFCEVLGKLGRTDMRPALDFEDDTASATEAWAHEFSHEVQRRLGVFPLFYSYHAFVASRKFKEPVGDGLWLASYGKDDGKEHPYKVPAPWEKAVMHQFTSNGRVPGVAGPCDVSYVPRLSAILVHPVRGAILPKL